MGACGGLKPCPLQPFPNNLGAPNASYRGFTSPSLRSICGKDGGWCAGALVVSRGRAYRVGNCTRDHDGGGDGRDDPGALEGLSTAP